MKILLLGATGRVGRLVLQQALKQGHQVTALVRNPAKVKVLHPSLTLVEGDARDAAKVTAALAGQDAVISALGHNSLKSTDVQTAATRAILASISPQQRIISLTGHGVPDPHDVMHPLSGRLLKTIIQLLPGRVFADAVAHEQLLRQSSSNWVLVRAPRIIGGPATRDYHTGFFPIALSTTVSCADVADFMLKNLTTDEWLRQAPLIAGR